MTLSRHLRAARVRAGLTQHQASEHTDIDRSQISDLERGASGVTFSTLVKLGDCYGCGLDELTGYAPPKLPEVNARELRAVNLLLSVMRSDL